MPDPAVNPRALVFDSGLGGLTVAREIRSLLPATELLYFADNAFFPYGTKDEATLLAHVRREILQLEKRFHPDIIVLACNSASTLVLPQLRTLTDTPIVGVVPAVKPAAEATDSGVIGLLATPGTVLRQYTAGLIEQFAGHCEVVSVGSAELVEIAEAKIHGAAVSRSQLQAILAPFLQHPRAHRIDTIVLACTHFPLLRDDLQTACELDVEWLDSGEAIARRVRCLLSKRHDLANLPPANRHRFMTSAPLASSPGLEQQLKELGFVMPIRLMEQLD